MAKTIMITGATDGIGALTAMKLSEAGHTVLVHGRNPDKAAKVAETLPGPSHRYLADLSDLAAVRQLANQVSKEHSCVDVLINNAGVLKAAAQVTADGMDIRYMVNTVAPYVLTKGLLPVIPAAGRVINLSSAAQSPVDSSALRSGHPMPELEAYAQSKLALTIWSAELAKELPTGPDVIAVNPGSLLATKMVKDGFGVDGNDLDIGANVLCEAATGAVFANATGKYYDNDSAAFAAPHPAAADAQHVTDVMRMLQEVLATPAS